MSFGEFFARFYLTAWLATSTFILVVLLIGKYRMGRTRRATWHEVIVVALSLGMVWPLTIVDLWRTHVKERGGPPEL